jgi:hypothetical protein
MGCASAKKRTSCNCGLFEKSEETCPESVLDEKTMVDGFTKINQLVDNIKKMTKVT